MRSRPSLQFPSQLVVPASLRREVLQSCHDDIFGGHLGFKRTLDKILIRFYWPRVRSEVEDYCRVCKLCAGKKDPTPHSRAPLRSIPVGSEFERVAVDVMGPLPLTESGNKFIVVFSDYLTKWPEAFAIPDQTAQTIAELFVEQIVCRHGAPFELLSDKGSNFTSSLISEICKICDTNKISTTSYHPQTDGLVERFNKTLITILSMYISANQKDWDKFIPFALFAYRTGVHESTKETPFYLLYKRDPHLPIDAAFNACRNSYLDIEGYDYPQLVSVWLTEAKKLAQLQIKNAQASQKHQYDRKVIQRDIKEGDLVYLHIPHTPQGKSSKLSHFWKGPLVVKTVKMPNVFVEPPLDGTGPKLKGSWVHINRLKPSHLPSPFSQTDSSNPDPPSSTNDSNNCMPSTSQGSPVFSPADLPDPGVPEGSRSRYNLRSRQVPLNSMFLGNLMTSGPMVSGTVAFGHHAFLPEADFGRSEGLFIRAPGTALTKKGDVAHGYQEG